MRWIECVGQIGAGHFDPRTRLGKEQRQDSLGLLSSPERAVSDVAS
jgi:hypothetical protein